MTNSKDFNNLSENGTSELWGRTDNNPVKFEFNQDVLEGEAEENSLLLAEKNDPCKKSFEELPACEELIAYVKEISEECFTLVDENMSAGRHQRIWNGNNQFGNKVTSGIYIYRLKIGNSLIKSRKMVLTK